MKWQTPKDQEEITKRRFAWLPTQLEGGETVWLEFFWRSERFIVWPNGTGDWLEVRAWQTGRLDT